jgi:dethiobiotin synthetase
VIVTGTDTGVGKTYVACGLARRLSARGLRVAAIKPIESGCGGAGEDGMLLAEASGQAQPTVALVRLRAPLAPPLAAELEGVELDDDRIEAETLALAEGTDVALIEGAGGVLTPLTWRLNAVELARRLGARALVVGSDRLGTVNHVLLSCEALERAGVDVAGIVLNAPEVPDASTGSNAATLARLRTELSIAVIARDDDANLDEVTRWLLD